MSRGSDGSPARGRAKATSFDMYSLLYLFPPPAATTTNCRPLLGPRYVMGVACALAGNRVIHSSSPVSLSNARNLPSFVAPIKTSPPAVTIDPPRFDAPVFGIPRAVSSSYSPRVDRQRCSPLLRSMAVRLPHGGF